MNFAKAYKKGRMELPYCKGTSYLFEGRKPVAACALGAAYFGLHGRSFDGNDDNPWAPFPELRSRSTLLRCPVCGFLTYMPVNLIAHYSDDHYMHEIEFYSWLYQFTDSLMKEENL